MSEKMKLLQSDKIAALKAGDRTKKDILTLIVNECNMIGKNDGDRAVTDNDVIQALNRTVKRANETRDILIGRGADTSVQDNEIEIARSYLPQQLTEEALRQYIKGFLANSDVTAKSIKGLVMKALNNDYKGSFDPRTANAMIDEELKAMV